MEGSEGFERLQQAWRDALANRSTEYVLAVLVDWDGDPASAVAWVHERIAAGENPGRWHAEANEELAWVLDADDDPRADLIDSICLEHHHFRTQQIERLARRASQIVELKLEEIMADDKLAGLFPGTAPWSRLERLTVDDCEWNEALMPGLARTALPAIVSVEISAHWDDRALAAASWLEHVARLSIVGGSTNPAWMGPVHMPALVELEIDPGPEELAEMLALIAVCARKPKLARIVIARLDPGVALPVIPGFEIVRG